MKLFHNVLYIDDDMGSLNSTTNVIVNKNKEAGIQTRFCRLAVSARKGEGQPELIKRMENRLSAEYEKYGDYIEK